MSDKLFELFCQKFPPTPLGYQRISVYPPSECEKPTWIERIHLDLIEKEFLNIKQPIVKLEEIGELAERIFNDINFDFYKYQEEGNLIFFRPNGIDNYCQKYSGHFIEIYEPLRYPKILISTGNRGSIELHPKQRRKYFQFVKKLYELFLRKIKI